MVGDPGPGQTAKGIWSPPTPAAHVSGIVRLSLISVMHKTIFESLNQRGALAIGGFGSFVGGKKEAIPRWPML